MKSSVVAIFYYLIFPSFAVKYRGRDDTIADRVIDRVGDQARAAKVESSQIRTGRVAPTSSHRKRLSGQVQFRALRNIRR